MVDLNYKLNFCTWPLLGLYLDYSVKNKNAINQNIYQEDLQEKSVRKKVLVDEAVLGQIRRQQVLSSIDIAINQTHQLRPLLREVVSAVKSHLPASGGSSIVLWDEARQEFVNSANTYVEQKNSETSQRVRRESGATRWIVDNREVLVVPDIAEDPFTANKMLKDHSLNAYVGVPLIVDEQCIGVLYAQSKEKRDYSSADLVFLKTLATRAAAAVKNVALLEEVKDANDALMAEKFALEHSQHQLAQSLTQLEHVSQEKSRFFASISHEIRTPLNAIIGFSELLDADVYGELNEKQKQAIGDILNSGTHLLDLVNDLLDLSKIDAGKFELELSEFDLYALLKDSLNYVRHTSIKKDIELSLTGFDKTSIATLVVQADKLKVKQIILNLLSNAVKYTPEGGSVVLILSETSKDYIISVKDTGIGISEANRSKLFQEFSQLDTVINHQYKGTGLGLVLSQRLAKLHGGQITLESTEGIGSTFSFVLPKEIAKA